MYKNDLALINNSGWCDIKQPKPNQTKLLKIRHCTGIEYFKYNIVFPRILNLLHL